MCGELREEHVGSRKTLAGWVARRRDHGGLVFVDLRDRSGITQLVINPEHAPEAAELAKEIRNEFVLQADGEVVGRAEDAVNPNLPTGAVEIQVETLRIVSRSTPLPFQLDEENVDETLRLRYRWLDLRRDKLQRNIRLRAQMVGIIRRQMEAAGFLDIQTPILYKSTPEGARDFVVPSRLHKGSFFALPQSPQLLKQLTMIAGFDRYYQIAICFRDEDLRADRVQEITQLDMETSFPDRDELFLLMEETFASRLAGVPRGRDPEAVPAHDLRRSRPAVRLGQAGYPLRARDRGCDRRNARLGVRGLRRRGCGALPARPAGVFAIGGRHSRGAGQGARREGARLRDLATRAARSALRSRSFSPSRSSTALAPAAGRDAALRRGHPRDDVASPRRAAAPARATTSA